MTSRWLFRVLLLTLLLASSAFGQAVNDGNETGFPVFGSFHGSKQENVGLQNGNLHLPNVSA